MFTRRKAKQDLKGPEHWLTKNKDPPGTIIQEVSSETGLGVFTTKSFSKGEFILEYAGELKDASQTADSEQTYIYYFKHNG
ncbi:hypothetical protein HOLleu_01715 [Holothuria leucospilota]|uniref:SET domain-containing protein n=1 Tax=Holothuria leucospilota TaxID=206669 RepID=A0A9Q1CQN7_HOLLE|nr:hypothetical protein HOLleu_01715 [Holothuria leucospilota]